MKYLNEVAQRINTQQYVSDQSLSEQLHHLKDALLKGNYHTRVESVARSGLSRVISIAYVRSNRIHVITNPDILKLAGCSAGGRICGCGMDMLFSAQYNLFQALCPNYRYQDRMQQYNDL